MTKYEYKPLTPEQKAAERELIETPENKKVRRALVQAYIAGDEEEWNRLVKMYIAPSGHLKALGKDFVKRTGAPTITCEAVNDTDWLK